MKSNYKNIGRIALFCATLMIASCSSDPTCEELGTCPELGVVERTDLTITGNVSLVENQQSAENDNAVDLVTYEFYGTPSPYIDFIIQLSNGARLIIKVYNSFSINPWEHINVDYAIYPTQDLDDKYKYVLADYIVGNESPTYSSNIGVNIPAGVTLDVFRITANNGVEIRCRIRDMVLYKNTDPTKTIEIDGTFVGAITFLN